MAFSLCAERTASHHCAFFPERIRALTPSCRTSLGPATSNLRWHHVGIEHLRVHVMPGIALGLHWVCCLSPLSRTRTKRPRAMLWHDCRFRATGFDSEFVIRFTP